ncbi:hypothetical protein [Nitrosopumilus piranensis]|uniref:Uncharacterized protein n=1 Tax=Nitrosopumilus piranensis TaxID=1582439 RepID=A0A0C5BR09_9ARCH|nr:hypothetical protein [Nitrosopumilus piranensis]AJM92193.1 hypothetical protein NPIRD3C_0981 [Nitrosopumilus piranensis]
MNTGNRSGNLGTAKDNLFYCKTCNSDPFTRTQKCLNFDKTLEQFHAEQGHSIFPYSKREQSITDLFTQKMNDCLPQSIDELKNMLKTSLEFHVDKEKTIDSDSNEFRNNTKGGFYVYEEKNLSQHFAKDFVSDIMLPGHVYDGKESCGKWKINGCLESDLHSHGGGYVKKTIQRCNYKGCKKCATNSIQREANSITNRLMTFCNLKNNRKVYLKENRSRILLHNIVSIPFEEHSLYLTKDGRKKLRAKAIKYLKEFDIDGGVMIDHPYRFSKDLESARLSPHLHLIVTGWLDGQKVKELYEKTGWIVTNVSTIETWNDCYNLSKYLLSHSAVFMKQDGKRSAEHSVRYFGECHNKKFKVETVLKYSVTGKEQLDSVFLKRKEIEKENIVYKLQKVLYTHSIIHEEIKDVTNEYFENYVDTSDHHHVNVLKLSRLLRRYIIPQTDFPKDNPAIPQSDPPNMEFLQMRFDYGHSHCDIVQSVYVNVIFDASLDELCPECSIKMQTLAPPNDGWSEKQAEIIASMLMDMPEDVTLPIDNVEQFDYLRNTGISLLGIPYFDFDGILQHDTGIYERPENLDLLNPKLYWTVIKNTDAQKARYMFKLENGRAPTVEELHERITFTKSHVSNKSDSIMNYL